MCIRDRPGARPNTGAVGSVKIATSSNYGEIRLYYANGYNKGIWDRGSNGMVGYWYSYSCDIHNEYTYLTAPQAADEAIFEYENARVPGIDRIAYKAKDAVFTAAQLTKDELATLSRAAAAAGQSLDDYAMNLTAAELMALGIFVVAVPILVL